MVLSAKLWDMHLTDTDRLFQMKFLPELLAFPWKIYERSPKELLLCAERKKFRQFMLSADQILLTH